MMEQAGNMGPIGVSDSNNDTTTNNNNNHPSLEPNPNQRNLSDMYRAMFDQATQLGPPFHIHPENDNGDEDEDDENDPFPPGAANAYRAAVAQAMRASGNLGPFARMHMPPPFRGSLYMPSTDHNNNNNDEEEEEEEEGTNEDHDDGDDDDAGDDTDDDMPMLVSRSGNNSTHDKEDDDMPSLMS
ncbi:hypothetical protein IV203_012566 [Nitzschia inconspicua]|uniref:Uncharacterized protein n=1 Tax=Nitzschia inconspicua TaxID=303405 RepID=A0A9K3KU04_9STRA|nr:hypothetical protein IV203_012566 [Nitzschia inconspicua]